MKRPLKLLSIVYLILSVLCGATIFVSQPDRSPNKFQLLGIDTCDGEICYRGIKIGTDWTIAQTVLSQSLKYANYLDDRTNGMRQTLIFPTADEKSVAMFSITPRSQTPPITAADVVATFGSPCRVYVGETDRDVIDLVYPMMVIEIPILVKNADGTNSYRLELNSRARNFMISNQTFFGTCNDATSLAFGPWRGFKSSDEYREDNRRDMVVADNP